MVPKTHPVPLSPADAFETLEKLADAVSLDGPNRRLANAAVETIRAIVAEHVEKQSEKSVS